jgi:hypothetical protein
MKNLIFALLMLCGVASAQITGSGTINGVGSVSTPTAPILVSITVSPASVSIANGASQQFTATGNYSDSSHQDLTLLATWTSGNSGIAQIGNTVPVQQVKCIAVGGPVTVTATLGIAGTGQITCTGAPPPTLVSIALTPASFSTTNGLSVAYTALGTYSDSSTGDVTTTATWHSSNTGVATIGTLTSSQAVVCGNPGSGTSNISANVSAVTSPNSPLTCNPPSSCGPPTYSCSPTNANTINPPSVPPQVGANTCSAGSLTSCGNKLGANTLVSAGASYNSNFIVRLTDTTYGNPSNAVSTGSGDDNRWNTDSTFISVRVSNTGADKFFSFNPSTMLGSRLYLASQPNGLGWAADTEWSRSNRAIVYGYPINSSQLQKIDISNCVTLPSCGSATAPSPTLVFDFKSTANCLGGSFTVTWNDKAGIAAGDAAFAVSFANSGGQGGAGAHYEDIYVPGKGCIQINTLNGAVTGDAGFSGGSGLTCSPSCTGTVPGWTANFGSGGFVVHNAKINRAGDWLIIVPCVGGSSSCGVVCNTTACANPIFWQIGTTNVNIPLTNLGGHFSEGYSTYVNFFNGKFTGRKFTAPSTVTTYSPAVINTLNQQHVGWMNADPSDTYPFLATTFSSVLSSYPGPYFNEVIGVTPHASATTFRFSPTFNTNKSTAFATTDAIGSVSQDGKFFAWSSDWGGTLGADNGSSSCTLGGPQGGTNCRGDVFVVELE